MKAAADAALARVKDWLNEFEFATDMDKAVAVALLLTAALRPSLGACAWILD
jgi:hypothetical protein